MKRSLKKQIFRANRAVNNPTSLQKLVQKEATSPGMQSIISEKMTQVEGQTFAKKYANKGQWTTVQNAAGEAVATVFKLNMERFSFYELLDFYNENGCPPDLRPLLGRKQYEHHRGYLDQRVAEKLTDKVGNLKAIILHTHNTMMTTHEKAISDQIQTQYGNTVPIFQFTTNQSKGAN